MLECMKMNVWNVGMYENNVWKILGAFVFSVNRINWISVIESNKSFKIL